MFPTPYSSLQNKLLLWLVLAIAFSHPALAKETWHFVTWDNDVFLDTDGGYSNGLNYSWGNVHDDDEPIPLAIRPLKWSMSDEQSIWRGSIHTIGHAITTPSDIKLADPDPNDVPYSALVYWRCNFIDTKENFADVIGTTIGLIGPSARGKQLQKFMHKVIGANEPQGWHHQLRDEPIVQLSRARLWRPWTKEGKDVNYDIVSMVDGNLGNLETSLGFSSIFRVGSGLKDSYPTAGLAPSRTSNPLSLNGNGYFYVGASYSYVPHLIFISGNTFEDSASAHLERNQVGFLAGYSHSWDNLSVTLSYQEIKAMENFDNGRIRFGSFTFAWRTP